MKLIIPTILILLMLTSISSSQNDKAALSYASIAGEGKRSDLNTNFMKQFEEFKTFFNSKNIYKLNEYINPEYGFFVLDNPGAFVNGYYFNSFDSIFNNSRESDMYRLKKIELYCKPVKGKLPVYRCDGVETEGWDKEGCYYYNEIEGKESFGVNGFINEDGSSGFDDKGNHNETHNILQSKFERNLGQTKHVFYSTDSVLGLYFGLINEKFYLLMVDLVTPCDA